MFFEPEFYLRVDYEGMDIEVAKDKVIPIIRKIALVLEVQKVTLEYETNGKWRRIKIPIEELQKTLEGMKETVEDKAVVIQYDKNMLFSNGGGCMFFKIDSSIPIKIKLAEVILRICGFSVKLEDKPLIFAF